jgi:hypothetical protein
MKERKDGSAVAFVGPKERGGQGAELFITQVYCRTGGEAWRDYSYGESCHHRQIQIWYPLCGTARMIDSVD